MFLQLTVCKCQSVYQSVSVTDLNCFTKFHTLCPNISVTIPQSHRLQKKIFLCTQSNETHNFQINASTRFLTSSTYFESHGFIIGVCLIFNLPPARLITEMREKRIIQWLVYKLSVCLMMKPLCSKHAEDVKNGFKSSI